MPKIQPFDEKKAALIYSWVRQGAYPYAAAEAAGLTKESFDEWMRRGRQKKQGRGRWREFFMGVTAAAAQARILAEIEVRKNDPKFWLKNGPGKEAPQRPGWTKEANPLVINDNRSVNLLASPEWNSLWSTMLEALADFPEARLALAQALRAIPQGEIIDQVAALPTPKNTLPQ